MFLYKKHLRYTYLTCFLKNNSLRYISWNEFLQKNTNGIGIGIINIHYDIESVMFATETDTETDVITPHIQSTFQINNQLHWTKK